MHLGKAVDVTGEPKRMPEEVAGEICSDGQEVQINGCVTLPEKYGCGGLQAIDVIRRENENVHFHAFG